MTALCPCKTLLFSIFFPALIFILLWMEKRCHVCLIPMLWTPVVVLHTNVAMSDFEVATFMFVTITQPVCLAFSMGLTSVFVFMTKAFNFVFCWVPKTMSLLFFARFIFYFIFFFCFRQKKGMTFVCFRCCGLLLLCWILNMSTFYYPASEKKCVVVVCVFFLSSTIYFGSFSLC